MFRKNKGSLTIEASISLVLFISVFLAIIYIGKLARAQIIIQHGVNQIALEVSKYSYLSQIIEEKELLPNINKNNNDIKETTVNKTDKLIGEIVNFSNVIKNKKNIFNSSSGDSSRNWFDFLGIYNKYDEYGRIIKNSASEIRGESKELLGNIREYIRDPKGLALGFIAIAKDEIADFAVSKFIISPICRLLADKYFKINEYSADEFLTNLGIEGGISGLNFDMSTIFHDGETINICAFYTMKIDFPLIPQKNYAFKVSSSTIGWGGDLEKKQINEGNKQNINIWDYGGKRTTDEFINIIKKEKGLHSTRLPVSLDFYNSSSNEFIYVHSMNTTYDSYCDNNTGEIKLNVIKSKIKYYANDALNDTKRAKKVVMSNGIEYLISNDRDVKMIIVLHENAQKNSGDINAIINEIKDEIDNKIEIEIKYSSGEIT